MILIILIAVYLVLNVYENFYRDQEKLFITTPYAKEYQKKWKQYQFLQWSLVFLTAGYYYYGLTLEMLLTLLFIGFIWNLLYDGLLNVLRGRNFFYISNTTQSQIEKLLLKISNWSKLGHTTLRLLIILIVIMLFIIIKEIIKW